MNDDLKIVSDPKLNKHAIVRPVDIDDHVLIIGDLTMNAVLIAHANTYEEAVQIFKNLNK